MHFNLYRARKFENPTKFSHEFSLCVYFIMRILIKILFYYKNDSGLIFSHKTSDKNKDFALFMSENTLKFILSKPLRARKIVNRAIFGPRAASCRPLL